MQIEELPSLFATEGAYEFPQTWNEPSYLASDEVSGNFSLTLHHSRSTSNSSAMRNAIVHYHSKLFPLKVLCFEAYR